MKKISILIPALLAASLVPVVSATACSKTQEQDGKYIEVELAPYGEKTSHRSKKVNLEEGKSYKFVINSINRNENLFYFANDDGTKPARVAASLHIIVINGIQEMWTTEFLDETDMKLENWVHSSGKTEIYITVSKTTDDVYAWTKRV